MLHQHMLQAASDQVLGALPDPQPHLRRLHLAVGKRPGQVCQHAIESQAEIPEGVNEGSVQINDDGINFKST